MKRAAQVLASVSARFGSTFLHERFVERSPLRFTYLTGPLAESQYRLLASGNGWSQAALQVQSDVWLNGLIRSPKKADAEWILFFPGNDPNQLGRGRALLESVAAERDYGLAVFAYRGYSSSGGRPKIAALARDAVAIVEHVLRLPGAAAARLHVVGFSIGGHLATRAVSFQARLGMPVKSLSLLASVNDIVMLRRGPWKKLALGDVLSTRPHLQHVPGPVLVLQGGADECFHGPQQGIDISRELGSRASYVEYDGVGHEALLDHEPALAAVREFIARV